MPHNIITYDPNGNSGYLHQGLLNKNMLNRKKAICEYSDVARPNALHFNLDYNENFNKNRNVFRRTNGIFTNVYDSAHVFGIDKPFKV
jgi:hypothetical protein